MKSNSKKFRAPKALKNYFVARFMFINFSSASSAHRQAFPPLVFRQHSFPPHRQLPFPLKEEIRHFLIAKLGEEREEMFATRASRVNEFSTSKKMDLHHFRFISRRKEMLKLIKIPSWFDLVLILFDVLLKLIVKLRKHFEDFDFNNAKFSFFSGLVLF